MYDRTVSWQLCLALVISLLIHLSMISGFNLGTLPVDLPESNVEVRLAPVLSKTKASEVKALVKNTRPSSNKKAHKPQQPLPQQSQQALPDSPTVVKDGELSEPQAVADDAPAQEEPVADEVSEDQSAVKLKPATYIETYFEASSGSTKGQVKVSYQVKLDGSYTLKSVMQVNGFNGLFLGALTQLSEGQVTPQGLKPAHYLYQYGSNDSKSRRADFDWQAGKLTMETAKKSSVVDLVNGTQDLLSFMYQFMFIPPLNDMQLSVTDGKKLRNYAYNFEGEDELQTELGKLRALHLTKSNGDGEDKTELWLAIEYNYLPVKIRKTEKDGTVIEQIATHISSDMFDAH